MVDKQRQQEEAEQVRSSNPKHPTLVGYKMGMLWDYVKLTRERLNRAQASLAGQQQAMRAFRQKWGGRRGPQTEGEWLEFWRGYVSMEDGLTDAQEHLREIKEELLDLAEQGREIVDKNGVSMNGGNPLREIEALMDRAQAMVDGNVE